MYNLRKLEEEQKSLKKINKTGEGREEHEKQYGIPREYNGKIYYRCRCKWQNRALITLLHNLKHEEKGSDYRHGVSCHTEYWYNKYKNEILN